MSLQWLSGKVGLLVAAILPTLLVMAAIAAGPTNVKAATATYYPFKMPQHAESVKATDGFEIPVRGSCLITTAPGTVNEHRVGGASENAVDITCQDSTVYAPYSGKVTYYKSDGAGNHMVIDHRNGYETHFFHLARSLVKEGDTVKKGQPVAIIGNTGHYTTGKHLHWEIRPVGSSRTIPIYGIKNFKFYNAPNDQGFFPVTPAGQADGVAEWIPNKSIFEKIICSIPWPWC